MSYSYMCGGNVAPSRFVKFDSTQGVGGVVVQAGAGEAVIGISQPGVRQPPLAGLDDGYAGIQNVNQIIVFTVGDICWVEAGGNITQGNLLKSDSSGRAVATTADGDIYGAIAEESNTLGAGYLVKVRVLSAPSYRGA